MFDLMDLPKKEQVAPRVGAWIETSGWRGRPQRERVAPRVGAWIETLLQKLRTRLTSCRAPRGRVD